MNIWSELTLAPGSAKIGGFEADSSTDSYVDVLNDGIAIMNGGKVDE